MINTIKPQKREYELVEYGPGWQPWTHCIKTWVNDGRAYGRPEERICTGWSNYLSVEAASRAFERLNSTSPFRVMGA